MKYLLLFMSSLLLLITTGCSKQSAENTGFNRDTVFVKFFENAGLEYCYFPAKVERTKNSIKADVHFIFKSDEVKSSYIDSRLNNINNSESFFTKPYALERFSHVVFSVDLNRRMNDGVVTKISEFDTDGNLVYTEDVPFGELPISTFDFANELWLICHTKFKVKTADRDLNMYMDEYYAVKDSLQTSDKDILSATTVDY